MMGLYTSTVAIGGVVAVALFAATSLYSILRISRCISRWYGDLGGKPPSGSSVEFVRYILLSDSEYTGTYYI